jgi:uncharacterized protein YndB with AHSA1/START domain
VIEYRGRFTLPASPDQVWSAVGSFDRYEEWWGWLKELRVDGSGLVAGTILNGTVVPPLPYQLRVQVTLVECVAPQVIRAAVTGDLQGQGTLELAPVAGATQADITWSIEMMQPALRLVARFARPLLLWGQDRVVASTVAGFRRQLAGG